MKKSIIALTALLCLGVPGVAVAGGESTDELLQRIDQLRSQVADRDAKIDRKNELLACERANRRELVRSLRSGERVGVVARCR